MFAFKGWDREIKKKIENYEDLAERQRRAFTGEEASEGMHFIHCRGV